MEAVKSLLVAGYSGFDLGIFSDNDPKVTVIKQAIRERLTAAADNGLEWLIFSGNLGFEYWAFDEAQAFRETHGIKLATLFPFETHGQNWNEANQLKLGLFRSADFVKYSFPAYENPSQFAAHDQFLIDNTDGALVLYDEENETRLHFLIDKLRSTPNYALDILDFEKLQEIAEDMQENNDE